MIQKVMTWTYLLPYAHAETAGVRRPRSRVVYLCAIAVPLLITAVENVRSRHLLEVPEAHNARLPIFVIAQRRLQQHGVSRLDIPAAMGRSRQAGHTPSPRVRHTYE